MCARESRRKLCPDRPPNFGKFSLLLSKLLLRTLGGPPALASQTSAPARVRPGFVRFSSEYRKDFGGGASAEKRSDEIMSPRYCLVD